MTLDVARRCRTPEEQQPSPVESDDLSVLALEEQHPLAFGPGGASRIVLGGGHPADEGLQQSSTSCSVSSSMLFKGAAVAFEQHPLDSTGAVDLTFEAEQVLVADEQHPLPTTADSSCSGSKGVSDCLEQQPFASGTAGSEAIFDDGEQVSTREEAHPTTDFSIAVSGSAGLQHGAVLGEQMGSAGVLAQELTAFAISHALSASPSRGPVAAVWPFEQQASSSSS